VVRSHVGEPVQLISHSSVAEQRLDKTQVSARGLSPATRSRTERATRMAHGGFPLAGTRQARCSAEGSARDSGSRGRRFEACHRDQFVRFGVTVAQWKSRGL
jgi:hypothetical protein